MSQSFQIDQLAESLSNMVTALSDIVAKERQSRQMQNQQSSSKKSQKEHLGVTYLHYLFGLLENCPSLQVSGYKPSYRLQEDLLLLLQLSSYASITNKCFEEIVARGRISRSAESLKSRYNDYLNRVGEEEMGRIVEWIDVEGLAGYLSFEGGELRLSLNDPKEERKRSEREAKSGRSKSSSKSTERSKEKKIRVPEDCKELNKTLKLYAQMVDLPIEVLLSLLHQVSGDFQRLDSFLETRDSQLLWSPEQDNILQKGGAAVEQLRAHKGEIEIRKKYLGIH